MNPFYHLQNGLFVPFYQRLRKKGASIWLSENTWIKGSKNASTTQIADAGATSPICEDWEASECMKQLTISNHCLPIRMDASESKNFTSEERCQMQQLTTEMSVCSCVQANMSKKVARQSKLIWSMTSGTNVCLMREPKHQWTQNTSWMWYCTRTQSDRSYAALTSHQNF